MAWTPRYPSVKGVAPVVGNILAYITTNGAAALLWANDAVVGLENFKKVGNTVAQVRNDFPDVVVVSKSEAQTRRQDGLGLTKAVDLGFELAVPGADGSATTLAAEKYVLAFTMMLWTMTDEELAEGADKMFNVSIDDMRSDYGQTRGTENLQLPRVVVTISFEEAM
jgi:hypothetical protein